MAFHHYDSNSLVNHRPKTELHVAGLHGGGGQASVSNDRVTTIAKSGLAATGRTYGNRPSEVPLHVAEGMYFDLGGVSYPLHAYSFTQGLTTYEADRLEVLIQYLNSTRSNLHTSFNHGATDIVMTVERGRRFLANRMTRQDIDFVDNKNLCHMVLVGQRGSLWP